jgi:hypothetical protein
VSSVTINLICFKIFFVGFDSDFFIHFSTRYGRAFPSFNLLESEKTYEKVMILEVPSTEFSIL